MCQFVGQEHTSRSRARRVLTGAQNNVMADRVGACLNGLGSLDGPRIRVHPDIAEVLAEPRLHEGPRPCVEGTAGGAQYRKHGGGCVGNARAARHRGVHLQMLPYWTPLIHSPLERWIRHTHHLIRDPIGRLFEFVARVADR
ncbi:hypothetical protein D3C72_1651550 [compost metagenome]